MNVYDESIKTAIDFYLLATQLKYKIRSGWDKTHWNVSSERLESVAEHIYGTCILAIALESEFDFNIDLDKVIKMLVIHELGEVLIGDITPFDNTTKEEKELIEHKAFVEIVDNLISSDELTSLFFEFDEEKTKEALFAHYCDKLEADIQAKYYQDIGCQHDLSDQKNNVVFKSSKINQMIENGAKTAFDIWYEYDKNVYDNSPIFAKTLKYIKENNTKIR